MKPLLTSLVLALQLAAAGSFAADYVREKKWADEVVPGVVVGDPLYLRQANGHEFLSLFTPAGGAQTAVVVVHGIGIHPDWGLIGVLRSSLADEGFTTLSIQMPVLANEATGKDYLPEFADAHERLALAVAYLKAKGYSRIAVVSHSLGSAMSYGYLAATPDPAIRAWVSLGMSPAENLGALKIGVLDMFGDKDLPEVLANAGKREASLAGKAGSRQLRMAGADHFFTGMDREMVEAVSEFLKQGTAP